MKLELGDLSFENIGAWPEKLRRIAIAGCCLILFLLGYLVDIKGQLSLLQAEQQVEQALKAQIVSKEQTAANFSAYKQQLDAMQNTFKVMLQQLPGQTEVPGLLEDISNIGIASGLEFRLFKPLPEKQLDFYAELPIQIAVKGNYHQLAEFVSRVSALSRIVSIDAFSIEPAPRGSFTPTGTPAALLTNQTDHLIMNMTAKTYRYTEGRAS